MLQGSVHQAKGMNWLNVTAIKQAGTQDWKNVEGENKWMPESGGAGNGGQWLHKSEENK